MMIEIKIPMVGPESTEIISLIWYKNVGDAVLEGDLLADAETNKVTLAIEASENGVLAEKTFITGQSAMTGNVIGYISRG